MSEPKGVVDAGGVKSARRALVVLETLSRSSSGMTFSEVQEELGYPKGSLHALLRTLTDSNWLRYVPQGKLFVLGLRAWEVGMAYSRMTPWDERADAIMRRVRDALGETIQLAVLDDFEALYIAKVDGNQMLKLDSSVGQRLKPHATGVGKMLLAGLPDKVIGEWLRDRELHRYTTHTITDHSALLAEIAAIRRLGYASDAEERTLGARCVAVGVRNSQGTIVAAMSISAPSVRFTDELQAAALCELKAAATDMSAAIGDYLPATRHGPGAES